MGLRKRLGDLLWPPEEPEERSGREPAPAAERGRRGEVSLRRRLQQVGVPDVDAKELERRQRILDASREAEGRARREAAYDLVAATCPVPVHAERIPLPGGLRLRDDEFLVATSPEVTARRHDLTLTTQRLIYTRGRDAATQLVVPLAEICDIAFHADDTITVGTPSGRWRRVSVAGNSVVASRERLLALIDHARARRSALPGGLDELLELRDAGALSDEEFERRRALAVAPEARRRGRIEVAGRVTSRRRATTGAEGGPQTS